MIVEDVIEVTKEGRIVVNVRKLLMSAVTAVLLTSAILFGQSVPTMTVQVQGTVFGPDSDSIVPGTEVRFESEHVSETVTADTRGFYQADLPIGLYTMTAVRRGYRSLQEFRRPLFRVASSSTLVLDVTLYPARQSCDLLIHKGSGETLTAEQWTSSEKNSCGGEDLFPIPAGADRFELYIRYPKRRPTDRGYQYSSDRITTNSETPVFVAYNSFSLQANSVIYDTKSQTIEASGHVVVEDSAGKHRADSVILKIGNGQAIPTDK
jgi:hypothetical protein